MTAKTISDKTICTLALSRYAGVGPRLFESLLHHFGNVERIVKTNSGTLMSVDHMDVDTANRISQVSDHLNDSREYITRLAKRNIMVVSRFDDSYPQALFELNDPPALLYVRGKFPDSHRKRVALVGADQPTAEGIALTIETANYFSANDAQVISTLYRGIDLSAHVACQRENVASFAVCESGFDKIQADESVRVASEIERIGGLLCDFPPETHHATTSYQQSNRILVGLSQAVVVTELYNHSIRTLDLLRFCHQIGKLAFILISAEYGTLADEASLNEAVSYGALPMMGKEKLEDIVKSLV